ncbi:4-hydroxybenzoate polyprenyltransferase [Hymenobacter luteus]|uniref:4-hydroxybenzoate polyprenyltransferase n=2 Tax=Hymenobacter TaxID=89966 RepID=A0A7W9T1B5_9BACT|nr:MULTISPECIES: hypothetical protein [Hymenobacter]MBB4600633.1 uncharacterized membrane protein (DUF485 family) [Hymenobacter latericoloratus]MBB6059160.1 4-hydroxybenzoate polyprenyltransferase [Hymenobacter luteus]
MLTSSSSANPLLRLKKNASRELSWVVMAFGLNGFNAFFFARNSASLQWFVVMLMVMLAVVGGIVYQRLQVLREMEQQHDDLYQSLKSRISRFRHLMRLHDYVGVVTLILVALTVLVVRQTDLLEYLQPSGSDWGLHLAVAVAVVVVVLGIIYAAYVVGKVEHQRRYGQHLDRLEEALRELEA